MKKKILQNIKKSSIKILFLLGVFFGLTFLVMIFADSKLPKIPFLSSIKIIKENPYEHLLEEISLPIINLQDKSENFIGKAVLLKDNIFVAPDHLWDAGEKKLYYKNFPIKLLVRDFANDILFFKLKQDEKFTKPHWSQTLPTLRKDYFWRSEKNLHPAWVSNISDSFETSEIKIIDLISFSASLQHGDSGTPVFDKNGKIYGIFIATDLREEKAYMVRADKIFQLAKEFGILGE